MVTAADLYRNIMDRTWFNNYLARKRKEREDQVPPVDKTRPMVSDSMRVQTKYILTIDVGPRRPRSTVAARYRSGHRRPMQQYRGRHTPSNPIFSPSLLRPSPTPPRRAKGTAARLAMGAGGYEASSSSLPLPAHPIPRGRAKTGRGQCTDVSTTYWYWPSTSPCRRYQWHLEPGVILAATPATHWSYSRPATPTLPWNW